ncbi:MAG: EamA family transporter RarD [bacterium]|nr:MAG: EamA family transporter RarD [bacterium]
MTPPAESRPSLLPAALLLQRTQFPVPVQPLLYYGPIPGWANTRRCRRLSEGKRGVLQGLTAYCIWGTFPLYFKALSALPATEILAFRIVLSALFLLLFAAATGAGAQLLATLRDRRTVAFLTCTTLLVATNWLVFISAVARGKVLESSLGYYINPLVSVLLAFVFLGERLTARQKTAIALAAGGVIVQTVSLGKVPLVSLVLAFSFGLYGLVRKVARVQAMPGLAVEMLLLTPPAAGYVVWLQAAGKASFPTGSSMTDILLLLAGIITATPLILYGGALNRLRLSTMGIMQYIVPSGHFILAVFVFGEPFTRVHLVSFGLIWAALALYTYDSLGVLRPATAAAGQVT